VKQVVRFVTITECEHFVKKLLSFEKTSDAEKFLNNTIKDKFPFLAIQ
jgi:hypothetical protein